MVEYTQKNFLRKQDGRWILENYNNFSPEIKAQLDSVLREYGQVEAQPFPSCAKYTLFLGTSVANLCKRAFYLFDAIIKNNSKLNTIIVLGNTEPYDKFLDTLKKIILLYPAYFREGLGIEDIPTQATMHETMVFILENLRWTAETKPTIVRLEIKHPSNTSHEISEAISYLSTNLKNNKVSDNFAFFSHSKTEKSNLVILSHQPFNDRQGLTAEGGFIKANLLEEFKVESAGPGIDTYSQLNALPASSMNAAQIVDNLTRTLYEIKQNEFLLLNQVIEEKRIEIVM